MYLHVEFRSLDENAIISKMKNSVIFDAKRCVKVENSKIQLIDFGKIGELNKTKVVQ